jgi:hypothetical protein
MAVYFIQRGENGPVKIGTAKDAARRRSALQTSHIERLTIVRLYEGGREQEVALHAAMAAHRLDREWFTPAVLNEPVGLAPLKNADPERRPGSNIWTDESYASFRAAQARNLADPETQARRRDAYARTGALTILRTSLLRIPRLIRAMDGKDSGLRRGPARLALSREVARIEAALARVPGILAYAEQNRASNGTCGHTMRAMERARAFLIERGALPVSEVA